MRGREDGRNSCVRGREDGRNSCVRGREDWRNGCVRGRADWRTGGTAVTVVISCRASVLLTNMSLMTPRQVSGAKREYCLFSCAKVFHLMFLVTAFLLFTVTFCVCRVCTSPIYAVPSFTDFIRLASRLCYV